MSLTGTDRIEYNFNSEIQGDTFTGATFVYDVNGTFEDVDSASICFWSHRPDGRFCKTSASSEIGITVGASNVTLVVNAFSLAPYPVENYRYDVTVTLTDGTKRTRFFGTLDLLKGYEPS